MVLQRTSSCWTKNISECGGALVTNNGANAKEAVTAPLARQRECRGGRGLCSSFSTNTSLQDPRA